MFNDCKLVKNRAVYLQIKDYIKGLILAGILLPGVRLPASRELAAILKVSRNTIVQAYQYLEDDGFIHTLKGRGVFVAEVAVHKGQEKANVDWNTRVNGFAQKAVALDIEKNELRWEKGMLSFKSIAPNPELFDIEDFKRAVLNRLSQEGEKLLNYGYARGYKYLLEYLTGYMKNKGVNTSGKELLITNGFTEGFNLLLSALTVPGDRIICENPTHNTALKIMRLAGLQISGVPVEPSGMSLEVLEECLTKEQFKLGFLIPSYHNPTGLVMTPVKRMAVLKIFEKYQVPVVEDGFNEELRYYGSHVAPLMALAGSGNGVVYLGSFSKVLFPGLRLGWIMADSKLVAYLESVKRSLNIHTSFLDQAILYEYLQSGSFEKYLRKARKVYREQHQAAIKLALEFIPCRRIWGEGGLHIFIELDERLSARAVLAECYQKGVLFMPGDIFYTDGGGTNTFRLGISRVSQEEMKRGFRIIGEVIKDIKKG
ncbi:MAG TPA: PLP-dependent aminotransferase family protein [Firmicutes bacterium]|jgi:DNA-binding transcriptional MocR family regulator|nr:PLP-dependent aminotransferase family protein [Bacillota bacterium]